MYTAYACDLLSDNDNDGYSCSDDCDERKGANGWTVQQEFR